MAVTGTPVAAPASADTISEDEIREFLRDHTVNNELLDDVEFQTSELTTAIGRALDHANAIARTTSYTKTSFPNKYILLLGTSSYLMKSEAFRQVRNQANYQDGNIQPIGISDKQAAYAGLGNQLSQEFVQLVTTMKISENMQVSGSLRSPSGHRGWLQ